MNDNRTVTPSRKQMAVELTAGMLASGKYFTGHHQSDAEQAVQLLAHVEAALRNLRAQNLSTS